MKAIVLDKPGSPDKLYLKEILKPLPKKGEILVKVHSVGLNPVDYKIAATGHPNWNYPFVLGLDVAGVIESLGQEVADLKIGDKVFYHGDLSKQGGFAEYAVTAAHSAAKLPEGLSYEEAAALPCAGLTAYQALYRKINIKNMKSIIVHGGAGGVGGFAIQLAKLEGLQVITTCSKSNNEWVKKLGADYTIDYKNENIKERIKEITMGRGVDVILNTISEESAFSDIENLAFNGHLICIIGLPDITQINTWEKAISVHTLALGGAHGSGDVIAQRDLAQMAKEFGKLVSEKKINPMVEQLISLEEIPSFLNKLSERHVKGKIVAKIL